MILPSRVLILLSYSLIPLFKCSFYCPSPLYLDLYSLSYWTIFEISFVDNRSLSCPSLTSLTRPWFSSVNLLRFLFKLSNSPSLLLRVLFYSPAPWNLLSIYWRLFVKTRFYLFLDSITMLSLSISLERAVIVFSDYSNRLLISPASFNLLFSSWFYVVYCWTLPLKSSISLIKVFTWLVESLSFYWPYLTCPERPSFSSASFLSLFWNELSSLTNLPCSLADCLNLSCPSLTYRVNPSTSLWDLSYFPPVYWSLLSSYLFLASNCSTCLLKASISPTNFWIWLADNLNFSCPYLTWPTKSVFSPERFWILLLKSLSWFKSLPVSLADYRSLFWPSLTCLSRSSLSVLTFPNLPSVSFNRLLS